MTDDVRLILGDCLDVLRTLPAGSVDAVVTDPPYPYVDRPYGRWDEAEWRALIDPVIEECRRLLTPRGSMMLVLQPNSEKLGRLRPWLWRFLADWSDRWNLVQDAWWWNHTAVPSSAATQGGLMRGSLKACVWLGPPDCHRDQLAVLWEESQSNAAKRLSARCGRKVFPSGHSVDDATISAAAARRGGATPFNVLPIANTESVSSAGAFGHGAGTPLALCRWWVRYLCPPGGTVLDPFAGSGTVPLAALKEGRRAVGVEISPEYCQIAERRIAAEKAKAPLFQGEPG